MSSPVFEVTLRPDPRSQHTILVSGVALMLVGTFIILQLNVSLMLRWIAAVLWIADCVIELHFLRAGASRVDRITLKSDGLVIATDADGGRQDVTLQSGTMIRRRMAWVRLQANGRRYYAGLFTEWWCDPQEWHRLQLLWRQSSMTFGHPRGP